MRKEAYITPVMDVVELRDDVIMSSPTAKDAAYVPVDEIIHSGSEPTTACGVNGGGGDSCVADAQPYQP